MSKPFTWSFSKLESFELCPKKYAAENVTKTSPFTESEASRYGKFVHKALEDRLILDKKLPLDLQHLDPFMKKLIAAPGEGLAEQKLALTRELTPTGWFDADVYCRSIIDYTKISGPKAFICDHKTGKRISTSTTQVEMQMAMLFCFDEALEMGTATYFWTKHKKFTTTGILSRDDMPRIWAGLLERVDKVEAAHEASEFPPRQNFLCKNYCSVSHCEFNGV